MPGNSLKISGRRYRYSLFSGGTDNGSAEGMFRVVLYRGSQPGRFPQGLGLGLTIAYDLVAAHGGSIGVDSTEERGTAFTVRLPRSGVACRQGAPDQLSA